MYVDEGKPDTAIIGTQIRPMTLLEQMVARKERLETELIDIQRAIDLLQSQPEVNNVLEAIRKVNGLRI